MNAPAMLEPDVVATIEVFDRNACLESWREVFGRPPPKHLSVKFMSRALMYEEQCRVEGEISRKTTTALNKLASGKGQGRVHSHTLMPGNHLVREWNGRTYQVEVLDKGFLMDGKKYASLSAIAKRITGAHWSGPRFFGLG